MSNVLNPVTLGFQHSGKNTDGSVFDATEYAGAELSLDGAAAVSIPAAFATDGKYQLPTTSIAPFASLQTGTHTAQVRMVAKNGSRSGLSTAGSFDIDRRTPDVPFAVTFA